MTGAPSEDQEYNLIREYAEALGLLVIYWASLENTLSFCLQKLASVDEWTSDCIATSIGKAEGRAGLIQRFALRPGHSPSDEWRDCVIGMCIQITNLSEKRNRLVHDDWFAQEDVITRQNNAIKIRKLGAGETKSILKSVPVPSHVGEIADLTQRTALIMLHMPFLCTSYERWKHKGRPVTVPPQAIQLSMGILPASTPLDD